MKKYALVAAVLVLGILVAILVTRDGQKSHSQSPTTIEKEESSARTTAKKTNSPTAATQKESAEETVFMECETLGQACEQDLGTEIVVTFTVANASTLKKGFLLSDTPYAKGAANPTVYADRGLKGIENIKVGAQLKGKTVTVTGVVDEFKDRQIRAYEILVH